MDRFYPDLWFLFGLLLYLNSMFLSVESGQSRNIFLIQSVGVLFSVFGLVLKWIGKRLHPHSVGPYLRSAISFFFYWPVVLVVSIVSVLLLANTYFYLNDRQIFMNQNRLNAVILLVAMIGVMVLPMGTVGVYKKLHHKEMKENLKKGWEDFSKSPKWIKILFLPLTFLYLLSIRPFFKVVFESNLDWKIRKADGVEWFLIFIFPIALSIVLKVLKNRQFAQIFQYFHLDFVWMTTLIGFTSYKLFGYGIFFRSVVRPALFIVGGILILILVSKMKGWLKRSRD